MAIVSTSQMWSQVAVGLENYYHERNSNRPSQYYCFIPQTLTNPLAGITPFHAQFFGPKVCIIFIVSKAYGVTGDQGHQSISWPPPGYADSMQTLRDLFWQWSKFELNFFGDALLGQKAADADPDGGSKFQILLNTVFNNMETDCSTMQNYGWNWRGRISSEVTASDFTDLINSFYASQ
jgi:hypothetical protein